MRDYDRYTTRSQADVIADDEQQQEQAVNDEAGNVKQITDQQEMADNPNADNGNAVVPAASSSSSSPEQPVPAQPAGEQTRRNYTEKVKAVTEKYGRAGEKYDDMLAKIEAEIEGLKKKRRKDERIQGINAVLAGITDFATGISDINTTNHYVPYTPPTSTMSDKSRERAARLRTLYDKDRAELMNYALNIRKLREDAEKEGLAERNMLLQEYKAQDKADRDFMIAEAKTNESKAKEKKDEAQAAYWAAKKTALENGMPLEEALRRAKVAKEYAQAKAAAARGEDYTTITTDTEYDKFGKPTKQVKVETPTKAKKGKGYNNKNKKGY